MVRCCVVRSSFCISQPIRDLMLPMKQNVLTPSTPTTFRLPQSGKRDPHFGLTRSFYYAAESEGQLKLIRIKKRGNQRGVTLIPYAAMLELLSETSLSSAPASPKRQA